jgi:acyl-CoA thioesterase FadM
MASKIKIPTSICFTTEIITSASDINYGGHVGNERYLLFAQETRIRFLNSIGCSETSFGPYGLILAESHVEYLTELFDGEKLKIELAINPPTRVAFECFYQIKTNRHNKEIKAAVIKTNMICFDYIERKVKSIPEDLKALLTLKSK